MASAVQRKRVLAHITCTLPFTHLALVVFTTIIPTPLFTLMQVILFCVTLFSALSMKPIFQPAVLLFIM